MTFYTFDMSHWDGTRKKGKGLVILTVNTPQSSEDVEQFLKEWEKIYDKCKNDKCKYTLLFDTREVAPFDPSYLVQIGRWLKKVKILTEVWMDCTAIVVSTPMIKTFIDIVFEVYKPVRPFKVFSKTELKPALQWALTGTLPAPESG